jgi:hypothetical protein
MCKSCALKRLKRRAVTITAQRTMRPVYCQHAAALAVAIIKVDR